jgi:D-alanyl-D-alanine carboxypeptidase
MALGIPADYGASRGMPVQAEASGLVSIGVNPDGREILLSPPAAEAWAAMRDVAAASGIALVAISGFRSIERQAELIRAKLAAGESIDAILQTVAAPGYSEHHSGRAVDIGAPGEPQLTEDFELTPGFRWLRAHAHHHGFHLTYPRGNAYGIAYEPWHWCHRPPGEP